MSAITFLDVLKANPYHDKLGRFTTAAGATGGTSFTPAATIEEAKQYAKNALCFSGIVDYSYSYIDQKEIRQVSGSLDIDTVNDINKTIAEIQDKYPEMKGYAKNLVCTSKSVYAEVVHDGRDGTASLCIGARAYKDGIKAVYDNYAEDVDLGYHPKGTTGEAIMWHEYGHVYAAMAAKKAAGPNQTVQETLSSIRSNATETRWKNEAANKVSGADAASYGKNISRYATKDDAELFAEAFAAHNTGHGTKWTDALMEAAGVE